MYERLIVWRRRVMVLAVSVLFLEGSLAALYRDDTPLHVAALAVGAAGIAWFVLGAAGQRVQRAVVLVVCGVAASAVVIALSHLWQPGDPQQWWWCLVAGDVLAWFAVTGGTAATATPPLRKARVR